MFYFLFRNKIVVQPEVRNKPSFCLLFDVTCSIKIRLKLDENCIYCFILAAKFSMNKCMAVYEQTYFSNCSSTFIALLAVQHLKY